MFDSFTVLKRTAYPLTSTGLASGSDCAISHAVAALRARRIVIRLPVVRPDTRRSFSALQDA